MALVNDKQKKDQKDRLNKVIMRVRYVISQSIDDNEITKIESLIVAEVLRQEIANSVLVPSKLPAPPLDSSGRME